MAKFQSTQATIENVRKQRRLEQQLSDIQRQWYSQLKSITRERLEVTKQWCHLVKAKREANHFDGRLRGTGLRRYVDGCQHKMQEERDSKLSDKYDFTVDPVEKMNVHLPPIRGAQGASADPAVTLSSKDLERMRHGLLRALSDTQLSHLRRLERMQRRKQRRERKKEKVPFQNSAPAQPVGHWLPAIPPAIPPASSRSTESSQDVSLSGALTRQKSMSLNHLPVIKEQYGLDRKDRAKGLGVNGRVPAVDAPF